MEILQELIETKRIIRYLVYRRIWTPYELEQKFADESEFTESTYSFGIIKTASSIGNDVFLQIQKVNADTIGHEYEISDVSEYYKLSDIKIEEFSYDNN